MDAHIDGVRVAETPTGLAAVVLLGVADSEDVLPIFIGVEEATSIARGQDATDIGRPLTHDLMLDVMEELGGRVDRVVISGLDEDTYVADLHIETPREAAVVDARPSDSLALAARTNADIEIEDGVFEVGRESPDEYDELDDVREVMA
ncbi:bifunctional nuclease family protein [Natronomonas halophila]|uniref:bifunctional nuclease family protein n=1 Tax=Natronomonas halophila TaxID=2747817 RepID=UPI0015B39299|nr:bifunctional nuclease domain-containing protein [Natronomonas halophila]QLD85597.1 bifunctional nuclease family protein [Natronomonas halophila]